MAMIHLILNTIELLAAPSVAFRFFLPLCASLCAKMTAYWLVTVATVGQMC